MRRGCAKPVRCGDRETAQARGHVPGGMMAGHRRGATVADFRGSGASDAHHPVGVQRPADLLQLIHLGIAAPAP